MREKLPRRSSTEMTCNKCGNVLCAPEWSFDFTEEGTVMNFWSCVKCRNQFETETVALDNELFAETPPPLLAA